MTWLLWRVPFHPHLPMPPVTCHQSNWPRCCSINTLSCEAFAPPSSCTHFFRCLCCYHLLREAFPDSVSLQRFPSPDIYILYIFSPSLPATLHGKLGERKGLPSFLLSPEHLHPGGAQLLRNYTQLLFLIVVLFLKVAASPEPLLLEEIQE